MFRGRNSRQMSHTMSNSSVEGQTGQTNAGAVVKAQGQTQKIASSTVYVVYNDIEEMRIERKILWRDVLSELQNYAFHTGFDLQWVDPIKDKLTIDLADSVINKWASEPNSLLIIIVGDKYGTASAPSSLRKEEHDAIRRAAFEHNADVKLFDQLYVLDRSFKDEIYRLNPKKTDTKTLGKLAKLIHKAAESAFEEGSINQVHEQRQKRIFFSPLHSAVSQALQLQPGRVIFVLRKLEGEGLSSSESNSFVEKADSPSSRKIEDLKNSISTCTSTTVLPHVVNLEQLDPTTFFASKMSDKYRDEMARQLSDRVKTKLSAIHQSSDTRPVAPVPLRQIAADENNTHIAHALSILDVPAAPRSAFDQKLAELTSSPGGYYLIQGPDLSGKTRTLCKLYEMVPTDHYKLIRFINLSYASTFAHEVWRLLLMSICEMANLDPTAVINTMKLSRLLTVLEDIVSQLNRPIFIFLDDIHLLKHGHFLSTLDKRNKTAPQHLHIIASVSSVATVPSIFLVTFTNNIDLPNEDEIIEILKRKLSRTDRKVTGEQLSAIKNHLTTTSKNIALAEVLLDEILLGGGVEKFQGGIETRLERIEKEHGAVAVQAVCKYLCVSSHGLSKLELFDVLSSNRPLLLSLSCSLTFPPLLLDSILNSLGNMDSLKELALCQFEYIDATVRTCGMLHLLSLYEECAMQVLHHDIQVLCEQVLLPAIPTVVRDNEQLAAEVIGRLRFTRAENSHFLNTMVEQAMSWVDLYNRQPLLVPLSCWISPPAMKTCRSFQLKDWKAAQTILAPTHNHQHVLISGNQSSPGIIFMYHIPSQFLITTFKGHTAAVTSLCSSNNGLFFISTSADKTVKMWSFLNGECLKTLRPHNQKITCSILSSDDEFMVTGSADSSAKVINIETGEVIRSFPEHTGSVVNLQLTSNNQFLITGSGDFVVQMFDIQSGRCICRMGGLMAPVSCLAITPNDAFVIVACEDETLRVFSTVSGQELLELMGHEGKVNALAAAQDDCQLFAATKSKIFCYDLHNGQMVDILDCQQPFPVCSLKISSDNYFLISGCGPRVHVWNVQKRILDGHDASLDKEGFVTAIAMSPDEKYSACGTFNGVVAFWDMEICQCTTTVIHAKGIPVSCLRFTLDNSILLSGHSMGGILILDTATATVIRHTNLHSAEIVSICSLLGGKVASCDKDGKFVMWNVQEEEDAPEIVAQGIQPPVMMPAGGRIIIGHCPKNSKEMKIWTIENDNPVQKNRLYHNEEITCFAMSSRGGSLVATASIDQSLKIWQIESGFLTQVLVGHEDAVTSCALAEDERLVVSGGKDKKVIVWSVATGQIMHCLTASASLSSIALTADATVVFASTEEGWLEAWSTDRGTLLSSFNAHRPIRHIISSFEANRLLCHLTACAQLPILCLHNSPAGNVLLQRHPSSGRAHSVASLGADGILRIVDSKGIKNPQILGGALGESPGKRDISSNSLQPGNGASASGGLSPSLAASGSSSTMAPPRSAHHPRPTFDKLERSKSRTSLIEKDRTTTLTQMTTHSNTNKSSTCSIL
ncbi:hypothetical protein WR25_21608 [Diploscapter pachys]|uniref:NWD1/2-like winged helix-turn-helix domain-containing protein n=1 Tax=Diploscapter pachys TaxID=2018661 RepID=A0A2A2K8Q5_9BILA|nr:hypothetical protein WR25_21608 [Diploscapter pachys]